MEHSVESHAIDSPFVDNAKFRPRSRTRQQIVAVMVRASRSARQRTSVRVGADFAAASRSTIIAKMKAAGVTSIEFRGDSRRG